MSFTPASSFAFKVAFGNVLRRVQVEGGQPLSWSELEQRIKTAHSIDSPILVTYEDEDGDSIAMDTDAELRDLVQRSRGSSIRLTVEPRNNVDMATPLLAAETNNAPVDAPAMTAETFLQANLLPAEEWDFLTPADTNRSPTEDKELQTEIPSPLSEQATPQIPVPAPDARTGEPLAVIDNGTGYGRMGVDPGTDVVWASVSRNPFLMSAAPEPMEDVQAISRGIDTIQVEDVEPTSTFEEAAPASIETSQPVDEAHGTPPSTESAEIDNLRSETLEAETQPLLEPPHADTPQDRTADSNATSSDASAEASDTYGNAAGNAGIDLGPELARLFERLREGLERHPEIMAQLTSVAHQIRDSFSQQDLSTLVQNIQQAIPPVLRTAADSIDSATLPPSFQEATSAAFRSAAESIATANPDEAIRSAQNASYAAYQNVADISQQATTSAWAAMCAARDAWHQQHQQYQQQREQYQQQREQYQQQQQDYTTSDDSAPAGDAGCGHAAARAARRAAREARWNQRRHAMNAMRQAWWNHQETATCGTAAATASTEAELPVFVDEQTTPQVSRNDERQEDEDMEESLIRSRPAGSSSENQPNEETTTTTLNAAPATSDSMPGAFPSAAPTATDNETSRMYPAPYGNWSHWADHRNANRHHGNGRRPRWAPMAGAYPTGDLAAPAPGLIYPRVPHNPFASNAHPAASNRHSAPPPPPPARAVRVDGKYAQQLAQLREMGFTNEALNADLLEGCNGDVEQCISLLTP